MAKDLLRLRDGLLGLLHNVDDAEDRLLNLDDEGISVYFFEYSFDEEMSEWLMVVDDCIPDDEFVASKADLSFDEGLEVVSKLLPGFVASGIFDDVTTDAGLNLIEMYGRDLPSKFDNFKGYMIANK